MASADLTSLTTLPAAQHPHLMPPPVASAVAALPTEHRQRVGVFEIDPQIADTAALCEALDLPLEPMGNCVVVAGKRGGDIRYAACVVSATTRADVNGLVRRRLDARKASFAEQSVAVELTGMEYGGITPVGLPPNWLLLIDSRLAETDLVCIGSGVRRSKLVLPGATLAGLPNAEVVEGLGR